MKFISRLLNLSFFILSFGQLARIAWPDKPVFFYLFEPILALATCMLVFYTRKTLFESPLAKSSIAFLSVMLLSLLISVFSYSFDENYVAILYFARLSMYVLFLTSAVEYIKTHKFSNWGRLGTGAITGWIILSSIVQYVWYPNLGNLAYLGWDPHLFRVVGLFFDPPITVSIFVLLVLYYAKSSIKKHMGNLIFLLPLVMLSLLTYSRGGYVGMIAVIFVYIVSRKNLKLFILTTVFIFAALVMIPRGTSEGINLLRTTSINARMNDYDKGISIWKKHPILGIGYNHIRPEKDPLETEIFYGSFNPSHGSASFHSSFLVVLVTGGVIGLGSFVIFLYFLARSSSFMMYSVIFLSVISLFDNVLLHPFLLFLLGYLGSRNRS